MNPALWLIGQHSATLDAEGRLVLPTALRNLLNPAREERTLMASLEPEGCAAVRETDAWSRHVDELRGRANGGGPSRRVLMLVAATSAQVKLDRQGRLRLPDALLLKLGLDRGDEARREVVISGNFEDLRVWSREGWERFEGEARENFGHDLELLRSLEEEAGLRAI